MEGARFVYGEHKKWGYKNTVAPARNYLHMWRIDTCPPRATPLCHSDSVLLQLSSLSSTKSSWPNELNDGEWREQLSLSTVITPHQHCQTDAGSSHMKRGLGEACWGTVVMVTGSVPWIRVTTRQRNKLTNDRLLRPPVCPCLRCVGTSYPSSSFAICDLIQIHGSYWVITQVSDIPTSPMRFLMHHHWPRLLHKTWRRWTSPPSHNNARLRYFNCLIWFK